MAIKKLENVALLGDPWRRSTVSLRTCFVWGTKFSLMALFLNATLLEIDISQRSAVRWLLISQKPFSSSHQKQPTIIATWTESASLAGGQPWNLTTTTATRTTRLRGLAELRQRVFVRQPLPLSLATLRRIIGEYRPKGERDPAIMSTPWWLLGAAFRLVNPTRRRQRHNISNYLLPSEWRSPQSVDFILRGPRAPLSIIIGWLAVVVGRESHFVCAEVSNYLSHSANQVSSGPVELPLDVWLPRP